MPFSATAAEALSFQLTSAWAAMTWVTQVFQVVHQSNSAEGAQ